MLNDIIAAISIRLNSAFGDGVEIHDEAVSQGLAPPCFCIKPVSVSQRRLMGLRYQRDNAFDILYFPDKDGSQGEINGVHDIMLSAMEYVTTPAGDLLRGTEMNCETVNGVGHFLVDYNFIVRKPATEEPLMEEITFHTNTNQEE